MTNILKKITANKRKLCFYAQTPPSLPPPTSPYTGGELVLLPENSEELNSPSVYRGKSPGKRGQTKSLLGICRTKGGSSPFRAQYCEAGREFVDCKLVYKFFI